MTAEQLLQRPRTAHKMRAPQTMQLLMCPRCTKYGQQRKSHKAGTWRMHWTKYKATGTCRTCGLKITAHLSRQGITTEEPTA